MSDLYDSLEDDSVEHNSSKSLGGRKTESTDSFRRILDSDSTDNYSFYLNESLKKERKDPISVFSSNLTTENAVCLPKIEPESREKGVEPVLNIIVDNKSLQEQGLQFNVDGSFTKSPRQDIEELPFITREYRNLQFQKRKTYSLNKKISVGNCPRKTGTFETEADTKPKMTQLRRVRKSKEELLTSESSSSTKRNQSMRDKHSEKNKNLTDSMKEKLLQTCKGDQEKEPKRGPSLLKAKQEIKSIESLQQGKDSTLKKKSDVTKPQYLSPRENSHKSELNGKRKSKSIPQKIYKYNSDIILSARKLKLNYSERHQLENGYNPFFLRQENKKVLNDTDRSNFGDSMIEDLPEVSSRINSHDNNDLGGEDEEMFYRKLIEKDKNLRQTLLSSRSEGPLETLKITGLKDNKSQKEGKTLENIKSKRNSKSLFIDMPSEGSQSIRKSKKCNHFCSGNASPKMSKIELALKAKTYGFLVNARNIYRLKAQSEGKMSSTGREKNTESTGKIGMTPPIGKLRKQNSLPSNGFPKVKPQLLGICPSFPRTVKTKQSDTTEGSQKRFALPQVNGSEVKGGKMNARLFERINSCLVSPHV